jgi:hypothetical protein
MSRARPVLSAISVLLLTALAAAQETTAPEPAAAPAASPAPAAAQPAWQYNLTVDGYLVPQGQSYGSPVFMANHHWAHLEARYNYEAQRTASLWAGYNFNWGKKVQFSVTPMIGGVFGDTNGIAPGMEVSVTYKKLSFNTSNEYVFDTNRRSDSFFYSWPELTYSLLDWLTVGAVAQRTKAYHTTLDTQRGFLVGVSHKQWEFTTYVFNPDVDQPSVVLEVGVSF